MPPRSRHPAEPGVEEQQPDQPEPERRHRVAEEADDADGLVDPGPLPVGGDQPHRHAEEDADEDAERRHLQRGREDAGEVVGHRAAGGDRHAEVAGQDVADVGGELHDQRPVEAHGDARVLVDLLGGAVADHREHRVDRHDAPDEEGDGEKPEEGQEHHHDEAGKPLRGAAGCAGGRGDGRQRKVGFEGHAANLGRCEPAQRRIPLGEYRGVCLNGRQSAVRSDGGTAGRDPAPFSWGRKRCDISDPCCWPRCWPCRSAGRRCWPRRRTACWWWRRTSTTSSRSTRRRPTSSPRASWSPTSTTGWCSTTPRIRRCWRRASPASGRSTPRRRPSPSPCATGRSSTRAIRCAPRTWCSPSGAW